MRPLPRSRFAEHELTVDGRTFKYTLADTNVRLSNGLLLRQVTRLSDDGSSHQTPILTSRRDLSAAKVAYWMFGRWRQENFFKYLLEEYALDVLVDYAVEPDNPAREVPNPAWFRIDTQLKEAKAALAKLAAAYGTTAFPGMPSNYFWSSSSWAGDTTYAWNVNFNFGYVNYYAKPDTYNVRCVPGPGTGRFLKTTSGELPLALPCGHQVSSFELLA